MYRISLGFISDMLSIIFRKNLAYTDGEKNAETGSIYNDFFNLMKMQ